MSYFLPETYIERLGAPQCYDIGMRDEWQDSVYSEAAALAKEHDIYSVLDYGTGSGFKLMKYFRDYNTIGVDLEPAIASTRKSYPDRYWTASFPLYLPCGADLVICSDVIEHVDDPEALLATLKGFKPQWLVISTPDRALLTWAPKLGPPANGCHVREWTFDEFERYIGSHFHIVRHWHSNLAQCTQCVVARLK